MQEFEEQLREALARQDPPAGFSERVIAAATAESESDPGAGWPAWVAAAGIVIMLAAGLIGDRGRQERAQGEQAKREVLLALRLSGAALGEVEERLRGAQPIRVRAPENN